MPRRRGAGWVGLSTCSEARIDLRAGWPSLHHHVAPHKARADHQLVEVVAFGLAFHHGMESVFQGAADFIQLHIGAVGALHVEVQHHRFLAPAAIGVE